MSKVIASRIKSVLYTRQVTLKIALWVKQFDLSMTSRIILSKKTFQVYWFLLILKKRLIVYSGISFLNVLKLSILAQTSFTKLKRFTKMLRVVWWTMVVLQIILYSNEVFAKGIPYLFLVVVETLAIANRQNQGILGFHPCDFCLDDGCYPPCWCPTRSIERSHAVITKA